MLVGLYADNTLPLAIDTLCEGLNALCKKVRFQSGEATFRLTTSSISSPSGEQTLSPAIRRESAEFDLTCLATHVPYDNNHFFDSTDGKTIVSFSGWNTLTDLPIANGFVYFVASILAHEVEVGATHQENTGCLNDFWWDKTGVDIGMRAAYICGECLDGRMLSKADTEIVADVKALLDVLSQASRVNGNILEMLLTQAPGQDDGFDVFLCHNSEDKDAVRLINETMKQAGIKTWFDEEQLQPGVSWQPELERQIREVRSACVCVGGSGFGPWQANETRAFLDVIDGRNLPVIPVLLPEASAIPELPIFLGQKTWIDLRTNYDTNLKRLIEFLVSVRPV